MDKDGEERDRQQTEKNGTEGWRDKLEMEKTTNFTKSDGGKDEKT